jgi:uncharacterized membrane-anchored protein
MKISKVMLILLAVAGVGQLAIPGYMIHRQEMTLRDGRAYKFRTRPVDPYDAFRGRYVALYFEQSQAPWSGTTQIQHREKAYARVEEGPDGFAVICEVTPQPPSTGEYFKVQTSHINRETSPRTVHFTMPFNRYYMEETKAPLAERAYRDNNRRGQSNSSTYAVVRIRDGHAALEDLYVGGKPIAQFLQDQPQK